MSANPTPPRAPKDTPAVVEAYVRALLEGLAGSLAALLNRPVTLDLEPPLRPGTEPLAELLPLPWLVCEARCAGNAALGHDLLISQEEAVALAGQALGQETAGTALAPEQEQAVRDLLNQVLAAASPALRLFLGDSGSLAVTGLRRVDRAEEVRRAARLAVASLSADAETARRVVVTVPSALEDLLEAGHDAAGTERANGRAVPDARALDLILDIAMPVSVELGRTRMLIRDILALGPGSVIELDRLAGEPVDLFINDRQIAKGEVVVIDESFGIRLTQISHAVDRIGSLG
jgi:flagellar motor switch protein FliN